MKECTKPLQCDANYDDSLYVQAVLNSAIFPQILYDIILYAGNFLPVKFFPKHYFNKLRFELPQNVMWTDENARD